MAARAAVDANPAESRAHTVLGFVHLAQIKTKDARTDFVAAIERDSSDPLPRLGLGLAIIRDGKLADGREQLEIAVALDPTNSLLRSYVGKAYYEENSKERDQLAAGQFDLAKKLDPNDPTPWFYDAIKKQVTNEPGEALTDLQKSMDLNGNRAVYRSRLLLDQDSAARSASLARVYNTLGFPEVARVEATRSLVVDPGNYSAHRFLADAYSTLPRHDIVRASELLQAQLRQPIGSPPLQTQLANDVFFGRSSYGPMTAGFYEFNPLFTRNQLNLQLFGLTGGEHTYGDQVIINGLVETASFSLSQYRSNTDGFRANNDLGQRAYDGFAQFQADESTSFQFEIASTEQESGDLTVRFDPNFFSKGRRVTLNDTFRVGLRHQLSADSDFLVSASMQDRRSSVLSSAGEGIVVRNQSSKLEVQNWVQPGSWSVVSGVSYFEADAEENVFGDILLSEPSHTNVYAYGYVSLFDSHLVLQPGLSYDDLSSRDAGDQSQLNPKLGVVWRPQAGTTLRAAAFRVLKRRINSDAGLEPTQMAGFAQFFDDNNGTDSHFVGGALDQRINESLYFGLEIGKRRLSIPLTNEDFSVEYFQWYERLAKSYINWLPEKWLSLTAGVSQEIYERPEENPGSEAFTRLKTVQVPLSVRFFSGSGLSASVTANYLNQEGRFINAFGDFFEGSESTWIADLGAYYYLPRRSGLISIEARNLFNQQFEYQAIDSSIPRFAFERVLLFRIALNF